MKRLITNNSTRFYYEKGDVIIENSTGKIIVVDSVDSKNKTILDASGLCYKLTTDIRPTKETKIASKTVNRSNRGNISRALKLKVLKYNDKMPEFQKISIGDWIDVRVNNVIVCRNEKSKIEMSQKLKGQCWQNVGDKNIIKYRKDDIVIVKLGFAMELPKGYEAEIKPRSGTFKNTGLILTNSVGCIDESYKGDNDEWQMMYLATRDGEIELFERLGQFRINKKMPKIRFQYVKNLDNPDRGGYSSTGRL